LETCCGYGYEPARRLHVALSRIFKVRGEDPDTAATAVLFAFQTISPSGSFWVAPTNSLARARIINGSAAGFRNRNRIPFRPTGVFVHVACACARSKISMWCNVRGAITFVRDDRSQNSSYLRPNYQTVSIRIYPHVGNGDETSIIVGTAQTQNWTVAVAQPPEPVICYDARSCNVRDDHICTGRSIAEQFVLTPELPNRLHR
jgi:hypothetical protein